MTDFFGQFGQFGGGFFQGQGGQVATPGLQFSGVGGGYIGGAPPIQEVAVGAGEVVYAMAAGKKRNGYALQVMRVGPISYAHGAHRQKRY
jgi:hypothetical protein